MRRAILNLPRDFPVSVSFVQREDDNESEGLFIAASWKKWYEAGNEPGEELDTVSINGEPLSFWLNKLEEKKGK